MRVAWVSFDVMGRDCLEATADAGAEVVCVVTLPGPIDPSRSGQCSFDAVAARLGAELVETDDINSPACVERLRAAKPDLLFVVGWSQLLREPALRVAPGGVFGMHPSLLPRHRGRAPIPWAILNGLAKTGVTLFEIVDPTADSGPIVDQVEVDIAPDETAGTLYAKLAAAHVELLRRSVPLLLEGRAPRVEQDARRASYWPRRTPADGIIDWETRAGYLDAWVRAQTRPYPGAFTFLGDSRLVVWRARPLAGGASAPAGTVLEERSDGVVVACGDGVVLLEEVQPDGSPPLAGGAVAGLLRTGSRLG
jgi:methionyl-tRNA formyltransferase